MLHFLGNVVFIGGAFVFASGFCNKLNDTFLVWLGIILMWSTF